MVSRHYSILVADDSLTEKTILQSLLEKNGHQVYTASDGVEAVAVFSEKQPDIVILDVMMPKMDGLAAAKLIKNTLTEKFVPVLFITGLSNASDLASCLDHGDDVLTKPFDEVILQAKLEVAARFINLYSNLRQQRDALSFHQEQSITEQEIAKKIFDNVIQTHFYGDDHFKYQISSMSTFNGDVLLVARKPAGDYHIMLGDFTGHGLPAAVGTLPVSDAFYNMTNQGIAMINIMVAINDRLLKILPTGFFCSACFLDVDTRSDTIQVWNCGIPTGILWRKAENKVTLLQSNHMPLGVITDNAFVDTLQAETVMAGDRVYVFSDGVTEAENEQEEMFGKDRLLETFSNVANPEDFFDEILLQVKQFTNNKAQTDDTTLLEYVWPEK